MALNDKSDERLGELIFSSQKEPCIFLVYLYNLILINYCSSRIDPVY